MATSGAPVSASEDTSTSTKRITQNSLGVAPLIAAGLVFIASSLLGVMSSEVYSQLPFSWLGNFLSISAAFGALVLGAAMVSIRGFRRAWTLSPGMATISLLTLAMVILLAGVVIGTLRLRDAFDIRTAEAIFTSPVANESVGLTVNVSGVISRPPAARHEIWLLNRPSGVSEWRPQVVPCEVVGSSWSCGIAYIGEDSPSESGKSFSLMLIDADSDADSILREYDHASNLGMSKPLGAEPVAQVTIVRR